MSDHLDERCYYVVTPDSAADAHVAASIAPVFVAARRPAIRGAARYLIQTPGRALDGLDGAVLVGCRDPALAMPVDDHVNNPDWREPAGKDWDTAPHAGIRFAKCEAANGALVNPEHQAHVDESPELGELREVVENGITYCLVPYVSGSKPSRLIGTQSTTGP